MLMANEAVTDLLLFMLILEGLTDPIKSPDQLVKWYPVIGIAVRVTKSPYIYVAWSGLAEMLPFPVEFRDSVYWSCSKFAWTELLEVMLNVAGLSVLVKSPVHPVKLLPASGVAVKVISSL